MRLIFGFALLLLSMAAPAQATIVLGGTFTSKAATALTELGYAYVDASGTLMPDPTGYGFGDTIVVSNDGGSDTLYDYNPFLNAGGRLVMMGGTDWDPFRAWLSDYFDTTDTASG